MDRRAASLLLYVVAVDLTVSAITHLMPLLGGRPLNPLPSWAGDSTFAWELAAACLAALAGRRLRPREPGDSLSEPSPGDRAG